MFLVLDMQLLIACEGTGTNIAFFSNANAKWHISY
jgi:hypothetical protein